MYESKRTCEFKYIYECIRITLKVKETKLYVRDTSHSQMTSKGIKVSERMSLSVRDEPSGPPTEMKNKK